MTFSFPIRPCTTNFFFIFEIQTAHVFTLHVIYSHPGINKLSTNLYIETHNGTHRLDGVVLETFSERYWVWNEMSSADDGPHQHDHGQGEEVGAARSDRFQMSQTWTAA